MNDRENRSPSVTISSGAMIEPEEQPGSGPGVFSRPSSHASDMLLRMWRRRREEDELLLLTMLDPN